MVDNEQIGTIRGLADALIAGQGRLGEISVALQLDKWLRQCRELGNLNNHIEKLNLILELAGRALTGGVGILEPMSVNAIKFADILGALPEVGDLADFSKAITSLQTVQLGSADQNKGREVYESLKKFGFPEKLDAFKRVAEFVSQLEKPQPSGATGGAGRR